MRNKICDGTQKEVTVLLKCSRMEERTYLGWVVWEQGWKGCKLLVGGGVKARILGKSAGNALVNEKRPKQG